jgi:hypothetical protein
MSAALCLFMRWWCIRENRRREERDHGNGRGEGWTMQDIKADSDKGDGAGFFRFTY